MQSCRQNSDFQTAFAAGHRMLAQGRRKAAARCALDRLDQGGEAFLNELEPDPAHGCIPAERLRFGPPETWLAWRPHIGKCALKLWPDRNFMPNAPGFADIVAIGPGFLVQRWIEGITLARAWAQGLDADDGLSVVVHLTKTVEALHAAGSAHGDITPANIILRTSDGKPVLIDWGEIDARTPGWSEGDAPIQRDRHALVRLAAIAAAATSKF